MSDVLRPSTVEDRRWGRSYKFQPKYPVIPRSGLKVGDIIKCSSSRFPNYAIHHKAVVVERYKRLNGFNKRYWNYYTTIEMLDGPYPGRRRTIVNLSRYHVDGPHLSDCLFDD